MIITSYNEGGFKIQTSGVTILTEAESKIPVRMKADIFIKTKGGGDLFSKNMSGTEHVINGPGEYEIKGVEVRGYPPYVYHIKAEGIDIGYFGEVSVRQPAFNPAITEKLMDVDIMFVATHADAAKAIRQFRPKIAVISGKATDLEKELGLKAKKQDKLVVKKKDLTEQDLQLVLL
ncbi:MAG: hypothetical protein ABH822_02480 [Patescibacteria group bacterium]